ncbi:ribonuclease Y [Mucisphaera calidilacus]|uniref:Ribonuclease Y n=1 Tax=Mucisphaera calidilacus TaxID=2527982 RepID=A0A518BW02_9BACT|nr:ribonuclease Y [Mucisphaera calidilacus]QDU71160.1 Ribonuclease Y [Mucisphaera calidilacus]
MPSSLILAEVSTPVAIIMLIGGVVVGGILMVLASRFLGMQSLTQARREAESILANARSEGETLRKQLELDARAEQASLREKFDKETEQTRAEIKEIERRLTKREDNLDRKLDALTDREKQIARTEDELRGRESKVQKRDAELDQLIEEHQAMLVKTRDEQKQELLRIANLSEDDARKQAIRAVELEAQEEAGQLIQRLTERAEDEARQKSLEITLNAIQRYASEHTAEATVSAIPIPSDDLKGRVIGREGRNIRAFEKATGVDVIVDDTPGVIVVSCFDPIRRAVASESLQKLIDDGRIHPTRIEEIVEQMGKEIQERVVKYGQDACIEAHVRGLNPRISEMMGRLYYRMSYGQNILRHSMEVAYLSQVIADQLGLDGELARRCGFLHDLGKAMDHEVEGGHPAIGMEFAKKHGETDEAVLNAIGGHHNDIPATTPYTPIIMAADAISGARPGARRETLEKYVRRLEQLEGIATDHDGVQQAYAIQAGREVRVIVDPDNIDDAKCSYIARDIAKRVSEEMTFPGEIKVTVLREMRTVEFAR